ncbi:MAG: hypothetical protein BWY55_00882 [archaeon ADurb.Bin336]|nr:MAG: hypothetical protein BWY55_00882 [archaeon ADurb.Bin336]
MACKISIILLVKLFSTTAYSSERVVIPFFAFLLTPICKGIIIKTNKVSSQEIVNIITRDTNKEEISTIILLIKSSCIFNVRVEFNKT